MSEEWTDWIEHDGKGCPCVGDWVQAAYLKPVSDPNVSGVQPDGTRVFRAQNSPSWNGGGITDGPIGFGYYVPILRYRVRKPRALQQLRDLIADVPAKEDA